MQTVQIGNRTLKCPNKRNTIIIVVVLVLVIIVSITLGVVLTKREGTCECGNTGAVASNDKDCSRIGRNILSKGGAAVDAAIGALLCEGVKTPQSMGLGGGFFMTIYKKSENKADFLNARERAPSAASEDMFKGNASLSRKGILSVAVPGELKGYWEAYKKYGGKVSWSDIIQPTIDLCMNGIRVSAFVAEVLQKVKDSVKNDPGLRSVYTDPKTGEVYREGDLYRHPKLAETLKTISKEGGDALHKGSLTKKFVDEIQRLGGIITEEDMNNYRVQWQKPVTLDLRHKRTLYTSVLPGSGVILSFMLNILKELIRYANPKEVRTYQRIIETFKFGYAKRSELGDLDFLPDSVKELAEKLTSDAYADQIRQKIHDDRTFENPDYYGATVFLPQHFGTANIAVLAPNGDAVDVTSTINLYFGADILLQETGIILNDEMDDFSSPNITNEFGIPPSQNNYIKPNKRPMSSMVPTIIVRDGYVELVVGAAGGSKITSLVALIIIRHLWFNMSIEDAVAEKRLHHQLLPMIIEHEEAYKNSDYYIIEGLQAIGHKTKITPSDHFSAATAISNRSGVIRGAYDWRRKGGGVTYLRMSDEEPH